MSPEFEGVPDAHMRRALRTLREELEDLQGDVTELKPLVGQVNRLEGELAVVLALTRQHLPGIDKIDTKVDRLQSVKTAIQFAAVVIVPILVALIGALVLLNHSTPPGP